MRVHRAVWLTFCGIVGLMGAIVAFTWSLSLIVLMFSVAAATGGVAAMVALDPDDTTRLPTDRWRMVIMSTVLAGAGTVAYVGLGILLGAPMATLVAVMAVGGSPYVRRKCAGWLRDHDHLPGPALKSAQSSPAERASAPALDWSSIRELESTVKPDIEVASLSDETLCLVWRASYSGLQRANTPAERLHLVEERMAYLDELERRNPHGVAAWLASGARAAGDPTRFVLGDAAAGRSPIDWDGLIQGTDK